MTAHPAPTLVRHKVTGNRGQIRQELTDAAPHMPGTWYFVDFTDLSCWIEASSVEVIPEPELPIRRFLDLSTNHLPQNVMNGPLNGFPDVIAYPTQYGFLMWVPEDPAEAANWHEIPAAVVRVQLFARKHGCDYVLFDADGPVIDDLPSWDW